MRLLAALSVGILLTTSAFAQETGGVKPAPDAKAPETKPQMKVTAETAKSPLDFTMKDIDGKDVALSKYRGKVVLFVNVASKCGLTPQYEQLQALHAKYSGQGLAIIGIPANNFAGQEPGTDEEIKQFCKGKYSVGFDMLSKVSVKGDDQCEFYKYLTGETTDKEFAGEIKWNFTKFLVDRNGKVIGRFEPKTKPDDAAVTVAIEKALAAKASE